MKLIACTVLWGWREKEERVIKYPGNLHVISHLMSELVAKSESRSCFNASFAFLPLAFPNVSCSRESFS